MKKWLWLPALLIILLVPIILIFTTIRILFTPAFLAHEYRLKNFPPDEYGFSTTERLQWGTLSINYLFNSQGIEFLADLKLDNGKPIYNERELSHMADVKNLVQSALKVWYCALVLFLLLTIFAWRAKWLPRYWQAIATGGWVTLGLVGLVLAGTLINFDELFTQFHHLFFTGDTWLFYANDTLIRLLPLKLWSDGFILMGVITTVGIIATILVGSKFSRQIK